MSDDSLLEIGVTFALLSLVSVGGAVAVVPDLHRQAVDTLHWMSDADFGRAFAIAQTAPGPNIMIVSVIGWRVAGLPGLLVATLAAVTPSCCIAFCVGRLFQRVSKAPWFGLLRNGLAPVPVGLLLASGYILARVVDVDPLTFALTGAGAAFVLFTRHSPLWILVAGALFGIAAGRLGLW